MRIIRLVIVSIISLLLIITIISLFIPSRVSVSRAVQINTSKERLMKQLSEPVNWKNWYPGADSSDYFYEDGVIEGLVLNKDKHHYIIISEKKNDEVIATYILPRKKIVTGWQVVPAADSNSVTVRWYMDFHLRWYPWEKFSSFVFERIYNPQLEKGLNNLKAMLEK
jgi:hypothetical protein